MKTTKLLRMTLLMAITCAGISACGNDDDYTANVSMLNNKADSLTDHQLIYKVTSKGEAEVVGTQTENASITLPTCIKYNGNTYRITKINGDAFRDNKSLCSIKISGSVTTIEAETFSNCSNLSKVMLPNKLTTIGMLAFQECKSMTTITIPSSLVYIGAGAFWNCSSLKDIYMKVTVPPDLITIPDLFCRRLGPECWATLHIPTNSKQVYKRVAPWNRFNVIVED